MLVLSRKHGEQIVLNMGGQVVTVAVLRIATGRVQIGIEAPACVAVRRQELLNRPRSRVREPMTASSVQV